MRELKFRAWNDIDKQYLQWSTLRSVFSDVLKACKYYTVEQFTGLKDKNGVEIYEGDIIRCGNDAYPAVVEFDEDALLWSALAYHNGVENERMSLSRYVYSRKRAMRDGLYVIGNIHQNAELLKGDQHD